MIYVDALFTATPRTAQARSYGTTWCHMTCDGDLEELHKFAVKLGLKRSYFQPHHLLPHYDLTASKRAIAVKLGAQETTTLERVNAAMAKRGQKPLTGSKQ